MANVRVGDVPLDRLGEFKALLAEALDEEQHDSQTSETMTSGHLSALWRDGSLQTFNADIDWVLRVPHERLEGALMDVCTPPDQPQLRATARQRLTAFLGGTSE
ncbi:hypothetical protein ACQBAR_15685 [Propionibacteriaceae bacterium Y1685]